MTRLSSVPDQSDQKATERTITRYTRHRKVEREDANRVRVALGVSSTCTGTWCSSCIYDCERGIYQFYSMGNRSTSVLQIFIATISGQKHDLIDINPLHGAFYIHQNWPSQVCSPRPRNSIHTYDPGDPCGRNSLVSYIVHHRPVIYH